jgi:hypothetical protein
MDYKGRLIGFNRPFCFNHFNNFNKFNFNQVQVRGLQKLKLGLGLRIFTATMSTIGKRPFPKFQCGGFITFNNFNNLNFIYACLSLSLMTEPLSNSVSDFGVSIQTHSTTSASEPEGPASFQGVPDLQ